MILFDTNENMLSKDEALISILGAYAVSIRGNWYNPSTRLEIMYSIINELGLDLEIDEDEVYYDGIWFKKHWQGPYGVTNIEDIGFQLYFEYISELNHEDVSINGYENIVNQLYKLDWETRNESCRLLDEYLNGNKESLKRAMKLILK